MTDTMIDLPSVIAKSDDTDFLTLPQQVSRAADKIVVMEAGRFAEVGRHEDLLAANGLYATLHELQNSGSVSTQWSPLHLAVGWATHKNDITRRSP